MRPVIAFVKAAVGFERFGFLLASSVSVTQKEDGRIAAPIAAEGVPPLHDTRTRLRHDAVELDLKICGVRDSLRQICHPRLGMPLDNHRCCV
jgi:hypothetical protein